MGQFSRSVMDDRGRSVLGAVSWGLSERWIVERPRRQGVFVVLALVESVMP
jgi:hypothetical protein